MYEWIKTGTREYIFIYGTFLSGNIPEYLLEKSLEESEKDFLSIAVSECVEVVLEMERVIVKSPSRFWN